MKRTWFYGPKPPKNTKQSDLGFPNVVSKSLPPLVKPTVHVDKVHTCEHGHFQSAEGHFTWPDPKNN